MTGPDFACDATFQVHSNRKHETHKPTYDLRGNVPPSDTQSIQNLSGFLSFRQADVAATLSAKGRSSMSCGSEPLASDAHDAQLETTNTSISASASSSLVELKAVAVSVCSHGRPLSLSPVRGNEQSIDLLLTTLLGLAAGLSSLPGPARRLALSSGR